MNALFTNPPRLGRVAVALLLGAAVLIGGCGLLSATTTMDAGHIGVVRNGGPLDNRNIRGIVQPASGLTWIGWFSSLHPYPSQQRFYTITADSSRGDRGNYDVVHTPTSDGVDVGLEGTIYFTLNQERETLESFDNKFGTREFPAPDGGNYFPWDGDAGWSAWLDSILRPVIDNDLREEISKFRCAELVSSCALVQNQGQISQAELDAGATNNVNITKIQNAINTSVPLHLQQTLGGEFLTGVKFNLVRVTLPEKVQEAVNDAQAAFAQVTQAQARVQSAKADAQANRERQAGYNACPDCGDIDKIKAISETGLTVWAPGNSAGIAIDGR